MVARRSRRWWLAVSAALGSALAPNSAGAHGLDAHVASVRISGQVVYIDATPGTRVFAELDDDGNGLMRAEEVKRHREQLLASFEAAFRVFDEQGRRGQRIFADVSTPHAHDGTLPAGADHLRFTFRYRFPAEPHRLRVQWFEAGRETLEVHAVRSLASKLLHEQRPLGAEESVKLTEMQPAAFLLAVSAELERRPALALTPRRAPAAAKGASWLALAWSALGVAGALAGMALWARRRRARDS